MGGRGGAGGTTAGSGGSSGSGGGVAPTAHACTELTAMVRDFVSSHPDFQFCVGANPCENNSPAAGMVKAALENGKPKLADASGFVAASGLRHVQSGASFDQWWNDAPEVNKTITRKVMVVKRSNTLDAIGSDSVWFPIDEMGHGNVDLVGDDMAQALPAQKEEDLLHNHLFTAEMHAEFFYEKGKNQIVITESDDDSWVFINNKLAADNGGLHGFSPASANLDSMATELGLESGKSYPISFFYADREMSGALLRVSFNFKLTKCTR
jgi:fibro-slime domain-containing protein